MTQVIKVDGLEKRYGDFAAVKGISFHVEKGEIFGLLGENGAGKTTTLEMIEGLRKPTAGSIMVLGLDSRKDTERIKHRIGVQLQSSAYFSYLTLREMLSLFGSFYGVSADPDELLASVNLTEKAGAYVTQLSGGQKQRFSIAAALVNNPDIVFLDEPTTGLDPLARRNLWGLITDIKKRGTTVVLTTHYLEEAELLCDRVAIMEKGEIVAQDKTHLLVERIEYPYAITFEASQDRESAAKKLAAFADVQNRGGKAGFYTVRLKTAGDLPKALEIVQATKPQGLSVRPASLEDVFIELTGKSMAEEENHA